MIFIRKLRTRKLLFLITFLIWVNYPVFAQKTGYHPTNLKCEYSINPMGIDKENPRFYWNVEVNERNWFQSAFQILVSLDSLTLAKNIGDIWNSGKILSAECIHIKYNGKKLVSNQKYFWKVKVWDSNGNESKWSKKAEFTTGLIFPTDWKGKWIASDLQLSKLQIELRALPDINMETEDTMWAIGNRIRERTKDIHSAPAVYFRKEFKSKKKVKYAVANICGLGLNELYFNGKKVSNDLLNPAPSDYQKRIYYQSYEVTSYLNEGQNAIGVILGNGWYNLVIPHLLRYYTADYINTPRLVFQLEIVYADNSTTKIVSDIDWKYTTDGPIQFNNLLSGETYDANKELNGWDSIGYNDKTWKKAIQAEAPAGKLEAQHLNPVQVIDTVKAANIKEIENGYSVDLEHEITGWCKVRLKGAKGSKITVKYPGAGSHTLGRYQTYEYILKGKGIEIFEAKFSYNGINTVEIYGLDYKPALSDITGLVVNTAFSENGKFSCSNPQFNEMYDVLINTMRNYVVHIPNDPVREKAGWTQDVQNSFDIYNYAFGCAEMYTKWQNDFLDIIQENGYVPPVVPSRFDGPTINGPWWGGMIVYQPWKLYQYYGDKEILASSFDAMKKYTGYLESIDSSYIIKWGLGDWLEPGSVRPVKTPVAITSTLAYFNYTNITAKTARILGFYKDEAEYLSLAGKIKDAFNKHFYSEKTGLYGKGSQSSQLLPLVLNIVPDDKKEITLKNLISAIEADKGHVGTGFVGTPYILTSMTDWGYGDVAYNMANLKSYPGWYDMVFNRGTKIFKEAWDGGGVQMPPLGGSLGYWFYYSLAGIQPDTAMVGFKNIIIKPLLVNDLNWTKGEYKSIYGTIKSEWKREKDKINFYVEIPANTSASIYLPTTDIDKITESDKPFHFTDFKVLENKILIKVGSGSYSFTVGEN